MQEIKRDIYLNKLINAIGNRMIKVVTGIRRSGKSYLLNNLFKNYLLESGVSADHIIILNMDERRNISYRDPDTLDEYIRSKIKDNEMYYVIIDEVQFVADFESVLNGFLNMHNLDVYVSGSNSKFLSNDIITEFRGRGQQIRVYPLSFSEFMSVTTLNKSDALTEYLRYGGMPLLMSMKSDEAKARYLKDLFELTYLKDIIERNNVLRDDVLDELVNILASAVGSLTSVTKLTNTFKSKGVKELSKNTLIQYLDYLLDSFLIEKVSRYDVKGKKYIQTLAKYYFSDIGLRNARLNFRQQEENHIIENVVYNELIRRGFNVDVGIVEIRNGNGIKRLEVDFVCNEASRRYYIQVTTHLDTREKTLQEQRPLLHIGDNFKKIIIVRDDIKPWYTEEGILVLGLYDFLLDNDSIL
ncbi:MAG TPA: ATP-binding protein [Bacilli bacterium]|nr:ATP-binding protein [Bacilli bacterium]